MSSYEILDAYADLRRELATTVGMLLKPLGLGPKQMTLLSILAKEPSTSTTELAAQTLTDPAAVSRALKSLEDEGSITKTNHPGDSRRTLLSLTALGRRKALEAQKVRRALARKMAAGLNAREQSELVRLLRRAADGLRSKSSEGERK
jgi:DNA-binding MarR family transcriptional regulator